MRISIHDFRQLLDSERPATSMNVRCARDSFQVRCMADMPFADVARYKEMYAHYLAGWIDATARAAADFLRLEGPQRGAYGRKKV